MTHRGRARKGQGSRPEPQIRILYEDQSLVVVDKPAGMPSVSPRSVGRPSAWSALRRILEARIPRGSSERGGARAGRRGGPGPHSRRGSGVELYLIHRLDQPASGLLVFARTERVRAGLKDLLAARRMSRRYAAVVEGRPREEQGEIRTRLVELEGPTHPVRSLRKSDGAERRAKAKAAVTRWRILGAHAGRSALEVELETGRKHQIRVHLAEAGIPVAGDRLYGRKGSFMGVGGEARSGPSQGRRGFVAPLPSGAWPGSDTGVIESTTRSGSWRRSDHRAGGMSQPRGAADMRPETAAPAAERLPGAPGRRGATGRVARGDERPGSAGKVPKRLLLHAWKLAFQHPVTRRKLEFVSPPGPEFEEAVPGAFRTS